VLLEGKRLLITGVLTDGSIAWHSARVAQEQGAEIVLTGFGRGIRLTERSAQRLPDPPDVLELDINSQDDIGALVANLGARWGSIDGALHAIAYAPVALRPLMQAAGGGSLVALDFDNSQAWPQYDWMGVAKSALQSVTRYLARELGGDNVRVNAISAGPLSTVAAKSIPGFMFFKEVWDSRAPLDWDLTDPEPVAKMFCMLMSDWTPMTSGEIIHVDGGFHAIATSPGEAPNYPGDGS
jgi:enoyl-[acyl-carrier protein] reductase I